MGQKGWKCDNNTPFFLVESKEWVLIYILTLLFFQKIFFVGPKKGKYGKKSGNWKNMKNCWNSPELGFKHFLHPIFSILCYRDREYADWPKYRVIGGDSLYDTYITNKHE